MVVISTMVNGNYKTSYNNKKNSVVLPYTWTQIRENLIWHRVIVMFLLSGGFFGSVIMYTFEIYLDPLKPLTTAWIFIFGIGTSFGTTAGVHRLWTHRSYKANLPLRILLMILYSATGMNSIEAWVRDHRMHHRYSDTDADPHNAERGFLFSNLGWLCMKRHPEYLRQRQAINMSDIEADRVVMFHERYMMLMNGLFCFVLPSVVPILLWEETFLNAVLSQCVIRYVLYLHLSLNLNSLDYLFGDHPHCRLIYAPENPFTSFSIKGKAAHNYHQIFPWDYRASELPFMDFNSTTLFIGAMAQIGWAYDLRVPPPELVREFMRCADYPSEVENDDYVKHVFTELFHS